MKPDKNCIINSKYMQQIYRLNLILIIKYKNIMMKILTSFNIKEYNENRSSNLFIYRC